MDGGAAALGSQLNKSVHGIGAFAHVPALEIGASVRVDCSLSAANFAGFPGVVGFRLALAVGVGNAQGILAGLSQRQHLPHGTAQAVHAAGQVHRLFKTLHVLGHAHPVQAVGRLGIHGSTHALGHGIHHRLCRLCRHLRPVHQLPCGGSLLAPVPVRRVQLCRIHPVFYVCVTAKGFPLRGSCLRSRRMRCIPVRRCFRSTFHRFHAVFHTVPVDAALAGCYTSGSIVIFS